MQTLIISFSSIQLAACLFTLAAFIFGVLAAATYFSLQRNPTLVKLLATSILAALSISSCVIALLAGAPLIG